MPEDVSEHASLYHAILMSLSLKGFASQRFNNESAE